MAGLVDTCMDVPMGFLMTVIGRHLEGLSEPGWFSRSAPRLEIRGLLELMESEERRWMLFSSAVATALSRRREPSAQIALTPRSFLPPKKGDLDLV